MLPTPMASHQQMALFTQTAIDIRTLSRKQTASLTQTVHPLAPASVRSYQAPPALRYPTSPSPNSRPQVSKIICLNRAEDALLRTQKVSPRETSKSNSPKLNSTNHNFRPSIPLISLNIHQLQSSVHNNPQRLESKLQSITGVIRIPRRRRHQLHK